MKMPIYSRISDNRRALLARKDKLLEDEKYCEQRIEQIRNNAGSRYYEDESSDSDSGFAVNVDIGPTIIQLKQQTLMLETCLQATQELTGLQVLESEVNVLTTDPALEREKPVQELGIWKEVIAECRSDLVPFSIKFYIHKSNRKFSPISYRGLRVVLVKAGHETELSHSILPLLTTPGEAVKVINSYATAHRSRRTTLSKLAEKYGNSLYMKPLSEGGYFLKCLNVLDICWTLENKWSPVAPFYHILKFNLEHMDESYVKIIKQTHKQLSDPSLQTEDRTHLLSLIISTCLEAAGNVNTDVSDAESIQRNMATLNDDNVVMNKNRADKAISTKKNANNLATLDREVMAPPKSPPKKLRKGKENIGNKINGARKRSNEHVDEATAKKLKKSIEQSKKTDKNIAKNNIVNPIEKVVKAKNNSDKKVTSTKDTIQGDINKKKTPMSTNNAIVEETEEDNIITSNNIEHSDTGKTDKIIYTKNKDKPGKDKNINPGQSKKLQEKEVEVIDKTAKNPVNTIQRKLTNKNKNFSVNNKDMNAVQTDNSSQQTDLSNKIIKNTAESRNTGKDKGNKNEKEKIPNGNNKHAQIMTVSQQNNQANNVAGKNAGSLNTGKVNNKNLGGKNVISSKNVITAKTNVKSNDKKCQQVERNETLLKVVEKNSLNKNKDHISNKIGNTDKHKVDKVKNLKERFMKGNKESNKVDLSTKSNIGKMLTKKSPFKMLNMGKSKKSGDENSKIPQLSSLSDKMAPLRMSPRNLPQKFNSVQSTSGLKKIIGKSVSNIPRLFKKPTPKTRM